MSNKQDVIFRGTREGLYLVFNDSQDFDVLKDKLREQLKRAEFFFQSGDVVLDTGRMHLSLDQILEIQNLLAYPYGLRLKKIVHGDQDSRPEPRPARRINLIESSGAKRADFSPASNAVKKESLPIDTLLYKGTLRSGQRILHDGNVVILGDVNPGAEIKATGDIVVMGALRGVAHAGAGGSTSVAVIAVRLEPTQLRIADVIGRPPENNRFPARGPEVARLKDGVIIVEPLEDARWEGEH